MLIFELFIRIWKDSAVEDRLHRIEDVMQQDDPWGNENDHIPLYNLAFWFRIKMYTEALNAVLMWIKLFECRFFSCKYFCCENSAKSVTSSSCSVLNFFPHMKILTSTLQNATVPLAWFFLVSLLRF